MACQSLPRDVFFSAVPPHQPVSPLNHDKHIQQTRTGKKRKKMPTEKAIARSGTDHGNIFLP